MKLIGNFIILFFLSILSFNISNNALANEEIELQVEKDLKLIQNKQLRLREIIDTKRQDCIQPLATIQLLDDLHTEFCEFPIEIYKKNNSDIVRLRNALSTLGFSGAAAYAASPIGYSIDIPGRGIGIGLINPNGTIGSIVLDKKIEQLKNNLLQYYKDNYKLWKSNYSSLEEYKNLSAHELSEFLIRYLAHKK